MRRSPGARHHQRANDRFPRSSFPILLGFASDVALTSNAIATDFFPMAGAHRDSQSLPPHIHTHTHKGEDATKEIARSYARCSNVYPRSRRLLFQAHWMLDQRFRRQMCFSASCRLGPLGHRLRQGPCQRRASEPRGKTHRPRMKLALLGQTAGDSSAQSAQQIYAHRVNNKSETDRAQGAVCTCYQHDAPLAHRQCETGND